MAGINQRIYDPSLSEIHAIWLFFNGTSLTSLDFKNSEVQVNCVETGHGSLLYMEDGPVGEIPNIHVILGN